MWEGTADNACFEWLCAGKPTGEVDGKRRMSKDYKPKEPLIKDEKIRKAVRAWAEANKTITTVHVMSNGYELYGGNTDSVIHFETLPFDHIKPGEYTIDELCGEGEE